MSARLGADLPESPIERQGRGASIRYENAASSGKRREATAKSLMRTVHAHPTLYEALGEAEHAAAAGAAIHI